MGTVLKQKAANPGAMNFQLPLLTCHASGARNSRPELVPFKPNS
jgi:hypothetical protein